MRTLVVEFQPAMVDKGRRSGSPGQNYYYCYAGKKAVGPGDHAIVHNGTEFGVVKILRVIPGVEPKVTKHILAVITQQDFDAYLAANQKIEEYRSLEDALSFRLRLANQRKRIRELAQNDPEAMDLLRRLEEMERGYQPVIEAEVTAPIEEPPAAPESRTTMDTASIQPVEPAAPVETQESQRTA